MISEPLLRAANWLEDQYRLKAYSMLEMAWDLVLAELQAGSLSLDDIQRELHKIYVDLIKNASVAFGSYCPGCL